MSTQAKSWGRKYPNTTLEAADIHALYIEQGGEVVAGCNLLLLRDHNAAYIEDVFTVESHQRQGLGSVLNRHALKVARGEGLAHCTLVAFATSEAFYATLGFESLSELRNLLLR